MYDALCQKLAHHAMRLDLNTMSVYRNVHTAFSLRTQSTTHQVVRRFAVQFMLQDEVHSCKIELRYVESNSLRPVKNVYLSEPRFVLEVLKATQLAWDVKILLFLLYTHQHPWISSDQQIASTVLKFRLSSNS